MKNKKISKQSISDRPKNARETRAYEPPRITRQGNMRYIASTTA